MNRILTALFAFVFAFEIVAATPDPKRIINLPSATLTDATAFIVDSTEGTQKTTLADLRTELEGLPPIAGNVAASGAIPDDDESDDAALATAAAASDDLFFPTGVYDVLTNMTFAAGKTLRFESGAKLKPASGVKITIKGTVVAGRYAIFDYSASGSCVFGIIGIGSPQNTREMMPEWWGAVGDNGSTDNATAFARLTGGTASENLGTFILGASYYNFVTGFTPKNKTTFKGAGARNTRLQFAPTSTATFITIGDSSNDIRFEDLQINSLITSGDGAIRTTAIGVASDAHTANNINLLDCVISGFNKRAIDAGGWIDCHFDRVRFENISNVAAYGGDATGDATAIYVRTFLNASDTFRCDGSNVDQFTDILLAASLTFFKGDHDQTDGNIDSITNHGSYFFFRGGDNINVIYNYFEGVNALNGNAMIRATNVDNPNFSFNRMTNLRGVTNVASIFIQIGAACQGAVVGGNHFKGSPGTAFIEVNAAGGYCLSIPENTFRDASDVQFITYSSLLSRMSEARTDMLLTDGMHWARPFGLPIFTKTQRDALTPFAGEMIYQSDNTPGVRFYENGAWVRPTVTADP